ncbi:hypothetical protein D1632_00250 [Chryseobacterium nematophagum]|uniref:Uncharacterized protein n=1 Tax=Chryseobacterium nematophagum TaxID=2305228 RepID=A0A3M7LFN3_9FLAO|nr:hypothetical protein D1632_00250 [Chryseobacterium nematophagum]
MINRYIYKTPALFKVYGAKYHKTSILIYGFMIVGFNSMYIILNNLVSETKVQTDKPDYIIYFFVFLYNILLLLFIIKSFVFYFISKTESIYKQNDFNKTEKYINEILSEVNCNSCSKSDENITASFRKNRDLEIFCETCNNIVFEMTDNPSKKNMN